MSTDTFETPRLSDHADRSEPELPFVDTDEITADMEKRPRRPSARVQMAARWKIVTEHLSAAAASLRVRAGEGRSWVDKNTKWRSIDAAIAVVWSLAVALIAIELALAVTPLAGIVVALVAGTVLGWGGRRLAQLIHTGQPRRI
jgi:hypothetical protein